MPMTVSPELIAAYHGTRLKRPALAAVIGLSQTELSRALNGKRDVPLTPHAARRLRALGAVLGLRPDASVQESR